MKVAGWLLILFGVLVIVFSEPIVFPGLEHLVGIETIVGKTNVYYLPDGGYGYTNPTAMLFWISFVRMVGVLICLAGALTIFRARRLARGISDERIHPHVA
jgi:hypothetical protein